MWKTVLGGSLEGEKRQVGNKEELMVRVEAIVPWAKSKGFSIPDALLEAAQQRASHPEPLGKLYQRHDYDIAGAEELLSRHCTLEIEVLLWVIGEFWVGKDKISAPKKAVIVHSIIEKYGEDIRPDGLSKTMAENIDSIVRLPSLRKGGLKKTNT